MEAQGPIGVFDSGIGGLTVVKEINDLLPAERVIYFGDNARMPYGPRSQEEVLEFSREITRFLLAKGSKMIVVACNTATAAALHHLRKEWPEIPFVGMEPAVKPGAKATRSGKVGVMATAGTFKSQRYASLMDRFAHDVHLMENPCIGLVQLIEAGKAGTPELKSFLRGVLEPMLAAGADTFVLGCTHYPFIEADIREIVGEDASIINPAPAVARQTRRRLSEHNALAVERSGPDLFYFSAKSGDYKRLAERYLGKTLDFRSPA